MDIRTKLDYITQHIRGVSRAEDTDSKVRVHILEKVIEVANQEIGEIHQRLDEQVQSLTV